MRLRSARWRERPGGEGAAWGSDVIVWWSCRARAGFEVADGRAIAWCEVGALELDPLSLDGCPSIVESACRRVGVIQWWRYAPIFEMAGVGVPHSLGTWGCGS